MGQLTIYIGSNISLQMKCVHELRVQKKKNNNKKK